jgi:hypothetical protein
LSLYIGIYSFIHFSFSGLVARVTYRLTFKGNALTPGDLQPLNTTVLQSALKSRSLNEEYTVLDKSQVSISVED